MTALLEGLEPGDGDGGQDFGEGQFSCGYREADGRQDDRQMVNRSSEPQRLFTIRPLAERAVEASLRYLDR